MTEAATQPLPAHSGTLGQAAGDLASAVAGYAASAAAGNAEIRALRALIAASGLSEAGVREIANALTRIEMRHADAESVIIVADRTLRAAAEAEELRASASIFAEADQIYAAADTLAQPRRPVSHRRSRRRFSPDMPGQMTLRSVKGVALGAGVAAVKHAGAHKIAVGLVAFTATAGTAAIVAAPSSAPPAYVHAGAHQPNPPASVVAAVPVTSPSPSYEGRHRKTGKVLAAGGLPAMAAPVVTVTPADTPSADPSPTVTVQAPGVLDVATETLGLDATGTATISFTAEGGPVDWEASCRDADVSLSDTQGHLEDGESGFVTVSLDAAGQASAGSTWVTFWTDAGRVRVRVSWEALVPVPVPSPVGSAVQGVTGAVDGAVSAVSS